MDIAAAVRAITVDIARIPCDVLPYMASIISKKKGNKLYYYVAESARVDGRPRIVEQTYLGSAERVAQLLKDRTAPVPVEATRREFGLPGALWVAARRSGVWDVLKSLRGCGSSSRRRVSPTRRGAARTDEAATSGHRSQDRSA